MALDFELVSDAGTDIGNENFPHAGVAPEAHDVAPAVPLVEIADHRDARRIGRPDGEMHTIRTFMMDRVGAELVEQSQMRALGNVIVIHRSKHGAEGIGIDERPFAGLVLGAIAHRSPTRRFDRPFEEPAIMAARERTDRRASQGLDADFVGAGDHASRDPLPVALLEAEAGERIAMRAGDQRGHLGVIQLPFGFRNRLRHVYPGMFP